MKRFSNANGWHGMRFRYGSDEKQDSAVPDVLEESEKKDRCCEKKLCGCGCYVATVDVDALDQQ